MNGAPQNWDGFETMGDNGVHTTVAWTDWWGYAREMHSTTSTPAKVPWSYTDDSGQLRVEINLPILRVSERLAFEVYLSWDPTGWGESVGHSDILVASSSLGSLPPNVPRWHHNNPSVFLNQEDEALGIG
jgi:hypothetical protein